MAVLGRIFLFPLHFQGQLKVVHKHNLGSQDTGSEHVSVHVWAVGVFPNSIWSRTFLHFVDKDPADAAAFLMRLKAKVTPVSPERLLRKGAYGDRMTPRVRRTPPLNQIWKCSLFSPITCQVLNLIRDIRQIFYIY